MCSSSSSSMLLHSDARNKQCTQRCVWRKNVRSGASGRITAAFHVNAQDTASTTKINARKGDDGDPGLQDAWPPPRWVHPARVFVTCYLLRWVTGGSQRRRHAAASGLLDEQEHAERSRALVDLPAARRASAEQAAGGVGACASWSAWIGAPSGPPHGRGGGGGVRQGWRRGGPPR